MDLAFLLAAAEHAAKEHHKSELPFFIAGGLLVAFAIAISVVGFKKPEFPANEQAARGVMALSVALVAGALGCAIFVAL
ncbi:MAG TPA: hypothetical protein VF526_15845 [Solirubrobacteraceae bacterium]|jgi:hypothetical protein